jgi:hypothetical protein
VPASSDCKPLSEARHATNVRFAVMSIKSVVGADNVIAWKSAKLAHRQSDIDFEVPEVSRVRFIQLVLGIFLRLDSEGCSTMLLPACCLLYLSVSNVPSQSGPPQLPVNLFVIGWTTHT